ncbi:copper ion binding protein [Paenibacillus sp. LMG 31456]|uniref:Copper ion binding protein n=1 Tax=Paenibacillus foliorum TaxID=2654974 RepID=A0A972GUV8_9BACL|nr:copper ion binding protein [Paenibacillus foliorum]NOU94247.1 copper ion binding protein [Paenibacillus foliorum]
MQNITLKVVGMTCSHCVLSVEGAVKKAGASAKVDLSRNSVSVAFDESKLSLETIKEAIEDQGYDIK